ncbi:MAG: adenylyl-sulfate kinase [Helicobacteraceae bacterium]|nr:adenylyl-sulfate kinase [Helicobacteraceae bacterium]
MCEVSGTLIYITGLSGSGKSTLAKAVVESLANNLKIKAIYLDGDILRECVGNLDYSLQGRLQAAMYYVKVAKMLVEQGFIVVLSTISMFEEVRSFNRSYIKNYLEVFLDVSLEIRKKRDSKGFFMNKTGDFAGVNQEVQLPTKSHLVFKDEFNKSLAANEILSYINSFNKKLSLESLGGGGN